MDFNVKFEDTKLDVKFEKNTLNLEFGKGNLQNINYNVLGVGEEFKTSILSNQNLTDLIDLTLYKAIDYIITLEDETQNKITNFKISAVFKVADVDFMQYSKIGDFNEYTYSINKVANNCVLTVNNNSLNTIKINIIRIKTSR